MSPMFRISLAALAMNFATAQAATVSVTTGTDVGSGNPFLTIGQQVTYTLMDGGMDRQRTLSFILADAFPYGAANTDLPAGGLGYEISFKNGNTLQRTISTWRDHGISGVWVDGNDAQLYDRFDNNGNYFPDLNGATITLFPGTLQASTNSPSFDLMSSGDYTTYITGRGGYALSTSVQVSAVPVPAAFWLFGSGLLGLAALVRRR